MDDSLTPSALAHCFGDIVCREFKINSRKLFQRCASRYPQIAPHVTLHPPRDRTIRSSPQSTKTPPSESPCQCQQPTQSSGRNDPVNQPFGHHHFYHYLYDSMPEYPSQQAVSCLNALRLSTDWCPRSCQSGRTSIRESSKSTPPTQTKKTEPTRLPNSCSDIHKTRGIQQSPLTSTPKNWPPYSSTQSHMENDTQKPENLNDSSTDYLNPQNGQPETSDETAGR